MVQCIYKLKPIQNNEREAIIMKVMRTVKMNVDHYEVGDIIKFKLNNGEKVEALAVKAEDDSMVFCLYDCLQQEYTMNELLNGALNGSILDLFPQKIRSKMVAFDSGNLLRLPTEKEITGENEYAHEKESDSVKQFKPMKLRRNRLASQGKNGCYEWYWLENKANASATGFALVNGDGLSDYGDASSSTGVRPLFKIWNR